MVKFKEESISCVFYSNSFFEAIIAKIKNPNIKIIPISPKYTTSDLAWSFFWTDGEYDYSFIKSNILFHWWETPWHKGTIVRHRKGYAKGYIAYKKHLKLRQKEKVKEAIKYFEEERVKQKLHLKALKVQKIYGQESRFNKREVE